MLCQGLLSGRCLKVAKCLNIGRMSINILIEAEGIVKQFPSCRKFSSSNIPLNESLMKEKLVTSLKNIKSSNNANHFCGLLLEANLILEQPERPCKQSDWRVYKIDKIVHQLQKVVTENKSESDIAGRLVEGIFAFLQGDFSHKAKEILPFLLELENTESLNQKYKDSKGYMKHLLKVLEFNFSSAIKLKDHSPRFSPEDSLHNLEILKTYLHHSSKTTANELLDLIFNIGQTRCVFSTADKEGIGNLMIDAIEPIEGCIEDVKNLVPNPRFSVLAKRSSLQFLIDEYSKFPATENSLLIEFYGGKISNSIRILDDLITKHEITVGSDDEPEYSNLFYREDYTAKDREKHVANMLPESHTWWKKSTKYYF